MSGFMMKAVHPRFCANASAGESENKKSGFGNPPAFFNRTAFVNAENNKGRYIDNNEIND